jgi:N-acyl-D-aspartate/D-glutamate deacylase
LGECLRDRPWRSLEDAIVRTEALPAHRFGLRGPGVLELGARADIEVFDPVLQLTIALEARG